MGHKPGEKGSLFICPAGRERKSGSDAHLGLDQIIAAAYPAEQIIARRIGLGDSNQGFMLDALLHSHLVQTYKASGYHPSIPVGDGAADMLMSLV